MPIPIFDIDDLSFFRCHGLSLRHTELDRGLREQAEGAERGDAVSLANYGRQSPGIPGPSYDYSATTCTEFQNNLAQFIRDSFYQFHSPPYNDAAFLLLRRGYDAKYPYDFHNYPLGKCGTRAFGAGSIEFLIRTDEFTNQDIDAAVFNTLVDLKRRIKILKLQKLETLLNELANPAELYRVDNVYFSYSKYASRRDLADALLLPNNKLRIERIFQTMINYYRNDSAISVNLFHTVEYLFHSDSYPSNIPQSVECTINKIDELLVLHEQKLLLFARINPLYSHIHTLHSYGNRLKITDEINGELIIQLADSLKKDTEDFFQQEPSVIIQNFAFFKENFINKLHEQDDIINSTAKQIIMNIIIALTGIGTILLICQLVHSTYTPGYSPFFFNNGVQKQQHIDPIDESLGQIELIM